MISTDFEARKAIIDKLGGNSTTLTSIFQCELVILALYGGDPSDVNNIFEADKKILTQLGGDVSGVTSVFDARKAIITQLGGSTVGISNNYEASLTHFELAGGEIPDITYYSVVFKNWDGTVLYTTNVVEGHTPIYNGNIPTRPSDEQYNYTFNGWTPSLGPVYGNIEYTASYTATEIPEPEPNIYTIKFINWNGDILQTMQVEEGQTPVYSGETPTRPSDDQYNYTFNGWLPAITSTTQDVTYIAQYIEEPLSVVPQYLRFGCSNESGSATIKVPSSNLWPNLQYRLVTDNIEGEWRSIQQGTTYSVSNNQYMEFRGNNSTGINTSAQQIQFVTTGNAFIDGNIMSLCDNGDHDNVLTLNDYAFYQMFSNTSSSGTLDASGLHLPYCSGVYCYGNLFRTNTALTIAPKELPATTLTKQCYQGMFYNCTNLVTGPEVIAATTVDDQSFRIMFSGCSNLPSTPRFEIKALEGEDNCYNMFYNCTSLTDINCTLPATTLTEMCYRGMFNGCTQINQAPELPATTLAGSCYYMMFNGCTSLTQAPELPVTTLTSSCYYHMFKGCTSLTQAPELPATTLESSCYYNMFAGCTSLTQAPELPATTLATKCYYEMFNGCTKLSTIKCLATDISATSALTNWTKNVASSGTFCKAVGVEWPTGISGIPSGWTVVEM